MESLGPRRLVSELFLRPLFAERRRLGTLVGALVVLALSESFFLASIKGFVKALFQDPGRPAVPLAELVPERLLSWFSGAPLTVPAAQLAVIVPAMILVAGLGKSLATYFYQLSQQALALTLAKNYRDRLFAALVSLPYGDIRQRPVGEWMSVIMNDVLLLQTRFSDLMTALVKDSVLVLACFVVLSFVHWPTALVLMALSPVIALGMGRTGKRIAGFTEAFQRELARMAGAVLDLRARFDFIRSQQGEARERARFEALTSTYYQTIRRSILVRSAFAPVLELIGFGVFAVFVWAIGHGLWGDFTPEVMMQFFVALGLLLRPLREMGEQLSRYHETKGSLAASLATFQKLRERGGELAAVEPRAERPVAAAQEKNQRQVATVLANEGWRIQRVEAGFGDAVQLQAEHLVIRPGRTIAIIGPSGAGKSTLIKTLAGLIEPRAWQANVPWAGIPGQVSMVSQEPFLFADTLRANLTYGLETQVSDDELWAALRQVQIDTEIASLPARLESPLFAVGVNVSGGQLQRLVIARSILRRKPVWLLDEATSAVDPRTEQEITLGLIAACHREGQALLAVTHRLTWLGAFDEVWFVEGGRLVFAAPHAELLAQPRYLAYCRAAGGEG